MAKGKVYRLNVHKRERWEDWKDQVDAIHYHADRELCPPSWFDWMDILRFMYTIGPKNAHLLKY